MECTLYSIFTRIMLQEVAQWNYNLKILNTNYFMNLCIMYIPLEALLFLKAEVFALPWEAVQINDLPNRRLQLLACMCQVTCFFFIPPFFYSKHTHACTGNLFLGLFQTFINYRFITKFAFDLPLAFKSPMYISILKFITNNL